eukprot:1258667-Rhodomonas_salina.1
MCGAEVGYGTTKHAVLMWAMKLPHSRLWSYHIRGTEVGYGTIRRTSLSAPSTRPPPCKARLVRASEGWEERGEERWGVGPADALSCSQLGSGRGAYRVGVRGGYAQRTSGIPGAFGAG